MIKKFYSLIRDFIFDLLFPRQCIGCGDEGEWICSGCLKDIDIIKQPFCPECRRPTVCGEFCEHCKTGFALDGIFICANFDEGVLKEAIHKFKYEFISDIGGVLGKIMVGKIKNLESRIMNQELRFDFIIPVPLHKKRKAWRGFNQAEVLGKVVSERLNIKMEKDSLVRRKYTKPQMELDREGRLKNLKEVFEIVGATGSVAQESGRANGSPLQGKNVLLVDDITTTGATLEECAKVLKEKGASSVWGIVLAKGK